MRRIVVIGGGPAGYEAALVAVQLGAQVTVVESQGMGGSCVLYDCVPSKTFIVSANIATTFRHGDSVGVMACEADEVVVNASAVHGRVRGLALAQSTDVHAKLATAGVEVISGFAQLISGSTDHLHRVAVTSPSGAVSHIDADVILLATGASPRIIPGAQPDGERILTWRQVYDLPDLPEELIIVGSGVTGAEFASAYQEMGTQVTLVSSRDRVMPYEDSDAANLIEQIFAKRGMNLLYNARMVAASREGSGVVVQLKDGRSLSGTHALLTVGSIPNTQNLGLAEVGVATGPGGHVLVDKVSRTNVPGIYAAGDCTGVLALASVAAMQGRIAMWHALGEAVVPLALNTISSNVFTDPEMATVGIGQKTVDAGLVEARSVTLPLATNARAKMMELEDGFVKLYSRPASGSIIGGVVVAPRASELILPIAMAVQNSMTVQQLAQTIAIYPSISGSLTEAARQLIDYHHS